jgi:hypothetical protein
VQSSKKAAKDIKFLQDQIKILRDGISQLSDAMLDEFTQLRREIT